MAVFVHFTDENNKNSIIKNGIKIDTIHYEEISKGIFCMPVLADFYATHQWVREIKQYNSGNEIIAIYFKIPDDEIVFCGKYNEKLEKVKAAETHKIFIDLEDKMGFQAIITRKVVKNEITRIKNIPQIIGWRHFPKSHERKRCLCPACLAKGAFKSKKIKIAALKKLFKELQKTNGNEKINDILYRIGDLNITDKAGTKYEKILNKLLQSNDIEIICNTINCMACLYKGHYRDYYFENLYNNNNEVIQEACLSALVKIYGYKILNEIDINKCKDKIIERINKEYPYKT
ncbi:hypothetical protein ACYULU_07120 [Breznakiellaceae bacterium SP9]